MRIYLILLLTCSLVVANTVTSRKSSAFDFLNHSYSAKSIGLGGVHSLIADDENMLLANPSTIGTLNGMHVTAFYQPYLMSTSIGGLGYAFTLSSDVVMAIDVRYKNSGEIIGYDELGNKTGRTFNPYALAFATSAAYTFDGVLTTSGGIKIAYDYLSGNYQENGVDYRIVSAASLLFDAGILYRRKHYALSSGLRNVGVMLRDYSDDSDSPLPSSVYTGISASLKSEITTNWYLESEYYLIGYLKFKAALEVPLPRDYVTLRAGTSFTLEDIQNMFDTFSGDKQASSVYSKQDIQLFSFGGTLKLPVKENEVSFDLAATINTDKVYPLIAASLGYDF